MRQPSAVRSSSIGNVLLRPFVVTFAAPTARSPVTDTVPTRRPARVRRNGVSFPTAACAARVASSQLPAPRLPRSLR